MPTTTHDLIRDALIVAIDDALEDALNDTENFKPEFLAKCFWRSRFKAQAEFFNTLAILFVLNIHGIKNSANWMQLILQFSDGLTEHLTPDAKKLIKDLSTSINKEQ